MLNSTIRFFLENRLIAFLLLIVISALGSFKVFIQYYEGMLAWTLGKGGLVWQRSTNGLLRQYVPYGTHLTIFSREVLDRIQNESNERNSLRLRTIKSK